MHKAGSLFHLARAAFEVAGAIVVLTSLGAATVFGTVVGLILGLDTRFLVGLCVGLALFVVCFIAATVKRTVKKRCEQLASELHDFLEERELGEPGHLIVVGVAQKEFKAQTAMQNEEIRRYGLNTAKLYDLKFHPRVLQIADWVGLFGIDLYRDPVDDRDIRHHFEQHRDKVNRRKIADAVAGVCARL
jgi:hypothetical protein